MNDFDADFFTNVAAVSVVLLFAKLVAHGVGRDGNRPGRGLRQAHIAAVVGAALALVVAFIGIERESNATVLHVAAWFGLVLAGGILVVDVVVHEIEQIRALGRSRS